MADRRYIEELAKEWEPRLRDAFIEAVLAIRSNVKIVALVEMLERGDVQGALRTVGLAPENYLLFENAIAEAFNAGGKRAADTIPAVRSPDGYKLAIQFNVRSPVAEGWLRQQSSRSITAINEDTREAARAFMTRRLSEGVNPRTTALDLVGRINPLSGQREGGVLGLTPTQEQWVRNYEALLSDPSGYKRALKYELGNGNFDKIIQSAIKNGRALTAEEIVKGVEAYKNNALRYRGETVARTETLTALGQSQQEAFRQAIDRGVVKQQAITKVWRTASDERVRHTHRALNGKSVGYNENFVTSSGALLRYPSDPLAPISETANCRCYCETRVDFLRGLR